MCRKFNDDDTVLDLQRAKAGFQFREDMAPGLVMEMTLKSILHSSHSDYQQIDVIETYFGKTLITDGKSQSSQFDEAAYHEALVHPSLLLADGPKRIFIGGGGELATARECLKHSTVEEVIMVDLDKAVVDVSVEYLPEWGGKTVLEDPRFTLIIGDAYEYLLNYKGLPFDAIIMDISDPIEAGPGIMLYTRELYQHASTLLSPKGVFVTQAGVADGVPPPHADAGEKDTVCFGPIRNTLAEVFETALPYSQCVPSFGSDWGFVLACGGPDASRWANLPAEELDARIEDRLKDGEASLKMYDGLTHRRMFALTKAVRQQLKRDTRIMTKDNPVFMY